MVTPAARREAVAHLRTVFEVSERRACSALGTDRSSVRYCGRRGDDAAARARLRELAGIRRRFGYRRLHAVVSRHVSVDPEKVQVKVDRGAKVSTLEVDVEFPNTGANVNAAA